MDIFRQFGVLQGARMQAKEKVAVATPLSPELTKIWDFVEFRHLILASSDFIVFIDHALDVDWKTTSAWDQLNIESGERLDGILNRAAEIEAADWDHSDEQKTLNFKRHIGEAIARSLDGHFDHADKMLDKAESYRATTLKASRRKAAVAEQLQIKDAWKAFFRRWTAAHYTLGITALLFSTLVASKPVWLGLSENQISFCAWLVAALTGLLTFLAPDKKADRYSRAWSILNSEITRYNADDTYTVNDVLDAYHQGEAIIRESPRIETRRARSRGQG